MCRGGKSSLDWQILWDTAIEDIPGLRRRVLNILTTEFPERQLAQGFAVVRAFRYRSLTVAAQ
jgi:hypothetical protein